MRWHAEILIHGILAFWIWKNDDGRPRFAAWLVVRFLCDLSQLLAERSGFRTEAVGIWYLGIVAGAPLLMLALHEAEGRWHRRTLFAWVAVSMAAAWIRFFPYTGMAVLWIDAAAYVSWIVEKLLRTMPLKAKTPR